MDRSTFTGNSATPETEIADNSGSVGPADVGLRVPARREIIDVELSRETGAALSNFILQTGAKATVTAEGLLGLRFDNGGLIVLKGSAAVAEAFHNQHGVLLDLLNGDRALFLRVLGDLERGGSGTAPLAEHIPQGLEHEVAQPEAQDSAIIGASSYGPVSSIPSGLAHLPGLVRLDPNDLETRRWGRDDIKRGEAGSSGRLVDVPVGSALGHLTGLGDEERGHRNGEKIASSDNGLYVGPDTPTGESLDHLWLLGDIEYLRASRDLDENASPFEDEGYRPTIWAPIEPITEFGSVEDTLYSGNLFDPSIMPLPITTWQVTIDPAVGTISFGPKGEFVFTPAPGYSGFASFDYQFRDPRTGLTIAGTVALTVEAVADPATISGSAQTDEDVEIATPVTIAFNDPDGSEDIEQVVITGLPVGAVLNWDTGLPGSVVLQPDGSFLVTGGSDDIQALLQSLSVVPPQDFDGRITLGLDVTTIERNVDPALPGYEDRETVHFDYHIDVEAVADYVTAIGDDEVTDEDTLVHLDDLVVTFGDLIDGSEVHAVEIRGVVADAKITDSSGTEYPFTLAGDGTKTYTLTPSQVADVYFLPPPDESGLFSGMSIVAIATETSNGDFETASAPITVDVKAVADPVTMSTPPQATDEDTSVTFGDDIIIVVNDPATQTLTQVVVSGFPAGTIVTYTPAGGGPAVSQIMPPNGTVTFSGAEADIRAELSTLSLTPPLHTDQNITLTISATTADFNFTDTQTQQMLITVAAVADGPTLSGSASGDEDQPIDLPITAARIDGDGSEQYDYARIEVPSGVTLIYAPTLPNGITVSVVGNVHTFSPGVATTAVQFQSFLATGLQVQAPADSDVNFTVDVRVGTIESVLSGGEVTLLRASDSLTVPVTVHPVTDMPTVTGSSTVDEDTSVTFGANIIISQNDKADGSESITQIVLGNIPAAATVTYTASPGVTVTPVTAAGITTYTISGGSEDAIRATLATFTLTPPLHSDVNISVSIAITKVDRTLSEGEAAATTTISSYAHVIAVAAVADGPTLSGSASGNEDQPIALPITAARIDADGSEQYDYARIEVPVGVTLIYAPTLPNGITVSVVGNVHTFSPGVATTAVQFQSFLATGLQVQAPADSDVNFTVDVRVGTIESVLSGGEVTLLRASDSLTVPVTVHPVTDMPTVTGSSTVDEDTSVTFGANIVISQNDKADGSESITQIVLGNIPAAATVTYAASPGVTVTPVTVAGITTYTISGGSEDAIRATLATFTLTPPLHSDVNISVSIAITKVDRTLSEGEAAATTTISSYAHVIAVAAVADGPTLSGSASGNEDQPIALPITAARIDADGSEQYDYARIEVPVGVTLIYAPTLPNGITVSVVGNVHTFSPGVATTAVQFQSFLATGLQVQAPADSDVNFTVDVRVGTIESVLSGGEVTLLRASDSLTVPVTVHPVTDMPTVTGSSTVDEDTSVTFGANIVISQNDKADGSESITQIVLGNIPAAATVTYAASPGVTVTPVTAAGITTYTISGGSEDAIRATLATFTLTPPLHSDVNIPVSIAITKVDRTLSEGEAAATTTVSSYLHTIRVAAVADIPVGSGSGAGLEDQSIPVSITVSHPDNADGSERIKDVVIGNIPAGFTLSESSTGAGTLTLNGNGTYTVAGPSTAAIQDVLANLTLVFVPNGARQHLDTEFNLSARVTTIESSPTESGAGEVAVSETFTDFLVPITVTAVADPVTASGSSVIQEDTLVQIGSNIGYTKIDLDGSESVTTVTISAFPAGATVTYTDMNNQVQTFTATGSETIVLTGGTEAAIRTALNSLSVQAPLHSDQNFNLTIGVTTTDNDGSTFNSTFNHAVVVQAIADAPSVTADNIVLNEDTNIALTIRPNRSADEDNSETLSVRITVPSDGSGPVGTLSGASGGGVTFTSQGSGVYLVTATGATPAAREAALDAYLNGGVTFMPRTNYSGVLTGTGGLRVDVISTEGAAGSEVAAGSFGGPDGTSQTETATTYISVTVNPVNDLPVLTNSATIVQENNNSTLAADPDLVVPIGTRLGMTINDVDGSQGLSLTLTGFPTNAQALAFATSIPGVTTNVSIGTGTITISGTNANNVIAVLNSLSVTLADDRDENFNVSINGTVTDTNGTTTATDNFSLSHTVTVQAVADVPTVNVGAATKAAVDEDSGFVTYAVTTALNDTDGSESYERVTVAFSTPGPGARSEVQFGTTTGVTFDATTPGQVVLTGSAVDINAAMLSLQVRPGANNGENITVTVTARSVESTPSEDNNGGAAGLGGGVAGPEISIPTAQTVASFTIPVTPVPEVPTISTPAGAAGTEDTTFALGAITVSSVTTDTDGSETRFLEIQQSSYPAGTQFISGGLPVGTVVTAGWLRVTEAQLASLSIRPPVNYSGTIDLVLRGVVVDTNASGSVTSTTAPKPFTVTVSPDADGVTIPTLSSGVEDNGAIAVGSDINGGLAVIDNGTGTGNNSASETITRVVLDFPADSGTLTYAITPGTAVGSAQIAFDAGTRTYTITSTLITGAADVGALTQTDRAQAETDIRATLAGFTVTMGPVHTDLNGLVAVTVTTLDVNNGIANTQDNPFNHTIRVQAVADTPSIAVVDPVVSVTEDGANVLLTINAGNSADTDNSETLSVRITVPTDSLGPVGTIVGTPPAGVTLTNQGSGVYLVTATGADNAAREAALDSFLNGGGISFDPRNNWAGNLTGTSGIRVDVISTEGATGSEVAANSFGGADNTSQTETVTDYIDILVSPVPDAPTVKGNGVGLEDTRIPIPMSITLGDKDGSETYVVQITSGVPAGARIYGAGGVEILPQSGAYTLTAADVAALAIQPPLNYSSALQGDIVLRVQTTVTDSTAGGSLSSTSNNDISVAVTGVADAPGTRTVDVVADEDERIELGAAILASAGGNLNSLLVDTDGSEALSFVVGGLPQGVIPTSTAPGGVTYLGNGTWSITAAAMPTLELPPVRNFSGENPYSGVTVRAVTQELDGDDASSPQWPVTITVNPIINSATVDGLANWGLGVTQSEGSNEAGADISLVSAANHGYVDDDGSEAVVSYTFDLSSLIADAGIAARLDALEGPGADLSDLVGSYVSGTFTYNVGAGTITVLAADIGGVAIDGTLFRDSNQDFSIPVSALVRDTAIIGGSPVYVEKIETGTLAVDLIGTADVPTVFATGVSGSSGAQLALTLGGVSTDTDVALGRALSEDIYYVLAVTNPATAPALGFTDGAGNIVGLDNGDGTWVFLPADLVNLHITTPDGSSGTANLRLTSIAVENDGDTASNSTTFAVTVVPGSGGPGGSPPMAPVVNIGISAGNEDGSVTLNVTAGPAPGDTSNPAVAVMISNLPAGATIEGARFNPDTGRWVASAAAVNAGLVTIHPPADFSGTLNITIEAVATNASLQRTSTGATTVPIAIDPVADGVAISAAPEAGFEDTAVDLNIALAERDIDGSEVIGSHAYVRLSDGATLIGGYPVVKAGDADASIDGTSLVGFTRVPVSDLATLQLQPAANWHGTISVEVAAYSNEPVDPTPDADNTQLDVQTFSVSVSAVADAPAVTAPVSVAGVEDNAITIPGLSAALIDTNATNGAEVLSVKISGVPGGSRFSAGTNNGDGSWTIPVAALSTLQFTPPLHYSGTMTLTLTAIALELSNGDEAQSSVNFNVAVAPRADTVEILAENVTAGTTGSALLDLNVRMADTNGSLPGENPPESIQITFTSVPTGVSLAAAGGGVFSHPSAGTWVFTGSQEQANAIEADIGATATGGTYTLSLSAVTIDGADTLATAVTDSFQLTVPQVLSGDGTANTLTGGAGTQFLFGLGGNDTLNGGADADRLVGGSGADNLTGGGGADVFGYGSGDLGTGIDTITDFTKGAGGDALDIAALLSGFDGSSLSGFVQIVQASGNSTIRIDADGGGNSFQDLVILQGVTGLDLNTMRSNGNLIV